MQEHVISYTCNYCPAESAIITHLNNRLLKCYVIGLPFWQNTWFWKLMLFGPFYPFTLIQNMFYIILPNAWKIEWFLHNNNELCPVVCYCFLLCTTSTINKWNEMKWKINVPGSYNVVEMVLNKRNQWRMRPGLTINSIKIFHYWN